MNPEQEFKCVFCSETFEDKETLQVHFRKHGDPNFKTSQSEEVNPTQRSSDQVEMVECDVCPEVFTSISKAITHKHKVHPDHDAKYFCPWCGKLFTMKHLYNKHIYTNHPTFEKNNDKLFPCDSCKVNFNVPAAMLYHNKFFHRQDTDLPTIGTSKKLRLFNQEVVLLYYCPFCGEEFENKVNLHKHIGDDHGDENQSPDDVLRCPLCDAVFYHLDAYELHLTHHSVDDMYSERNELADQITDFSLESVPPMAEKVESLEVGEENNEKVGIEHLLEFAMEEQKDKKSKKHKKHKKSKKSAITLDEFFSMNKDVFGEEIDFEGVEEVPTQVVKKKLKAKRPPAPKFKNTPDIEKLKKQGIVVKKNHGPVLKKSLVKISQNLTKTNMKAPDNSSSADALSKLLNQSNMQLKIVRKSNVNTAISEQKIEKYPEDETPDMPLKSSENQSEPDINTSNEKAEENEFANQDSDETNPKNDLEKQLDNSSKDLPTDDAHAVKSQITEKNSNSTNQLTKLLKNNTNIVIKSKPNIVKSNEEIKMPNKIIERYIEETDDEEDHEMEHNANTNNSINVLKHLNHLTVKSNNQNKSHGLSKNDGKIPDIKKVSTEEKSPQNINKFKNVAIPLPFKNDSMDDENEDGEEEYDPQTEELQKTTDKIDSVLNNPHLSIQTKSSPIATPSKESPKENVASNTSSLDILKHLKNLTAKPLNKSNNVKTPQGSPNIKQEPKSPPYPMTKQVEENIEIYNIDDSDTDEEYKGPKKNIVPQNKFSNNLKYLNKNITIKSINQNTNKINKAVTGVVKMGSKYDDRNDDHLNNITFEKQDIPQIKTPIQKVIPDAIKNLNKNITIKSRNSSPQNIKVQNQLLQGYDTNSEDEENEDLQNNQLKITEIENMGDEELPLNTNPHDTPHNVKVKLPDDSESDHDNEHTDHEDDDNFFSDEDIEAQINSTKLMKKIPNNPTPNHNINTLKKLSKDITIKSSNDTSIESVVNTPADNIPPFAKSLRNQILIKNPRVNNMKAVNSPRPIEKSMARQVTQSTNQKMLSNQVNTKEVKTVQTFQTQTQTVIEEITTTVTKTIKTVNQTMKQESRQESGQCSTTESFQRFPHQSQRNYQGVKVRQAPPLGPRVRNVMQPMRAPGSVRPVTQAVPLRQPFNAPRVNRPRMAGPKSTMRPPTQIPPKVQGGPVKTANNPANKRLNTEDATAHFSCFKKPKESLIPVDDFPNPSNAESVQYSKSIQMNKSNFTCTASAVKGDSMMTSTQTRSEISSQQLSKLKNMSGLSVVKTSQYKQAHVEEKNEMSASQKTTLDAIMRLQSQGLLVKKPRISADEEEQSEVCDTGHDSNEYYDDE